MRSGMRRAGIMALICHFLLLQQAPLDLPGGGFGDGYVAWRSPVYRSFAMGKQRIELLRGDSHSESPVFLCFLVFQVLTFSYLL